MTDAPKLALDLTYSLKEHNRGQITVIQTWFLDDTKQACLVLVPTHARREKGRFVPGIVTMQEAWRWDEVTGDPVFAFENSQAFARGLGFNENDPNTVFSITRIVQELLGDLILQMPFERYVQQQGVADVIVTDANTGKTRELEVKDYVNVH